MIKENIERVYQNARIRNRDCNVQSVSSFMQISKKWLDGEIKPNTVKMLWNTALWNYVDNPLRNAENPISKWVRAIYSTCTVQVCGSGLSWFGSDLNKDNIWLISSDLKVIIFEILIVCYIFDKKNIERFYQNARILICKSQKK